MNEFLLLVLWVQPKLQNIYIKSSNKYNKRVQALGGAKNHAVVMPDADMENVVKSLIGAAYGSCGERCMAISVVVCVGDDIADTLVQRLSHEISNFKIGEGTNSKNHLGPAHH